MATPSELDEAALADLRHRYEPSVRTHWADCYKDHAFCAVVRLCDELTAARQRIAELEDAASRQQDEICQTLGRALGYPRFADDAANFPEATDATDVCVGDHVAESLAAEAAQRIAALEGERDQIRRTVHGWAGIAAAHTYTPPQGVTITTTSAPPSGKYGQTGRAFASAVCPACSAHVWRDQFTGLFWTEGGLARHEHPATPAAREGDRELCLGCGQRAVEIVHRQAETMRAGVRVTFPDELSRCAACGEEFYTFEQSMAHSRAAKAALDGAPT